MEKERKENSVVADEKNKESALAAKKANKMLAVYR